MDSPARRQTQPSFDLKSYLTSVRRLVDQHLEQWLKPIGDNRLTDAMRYSLMAGGKRLRPVLTIAAAEAVGGTADQVMAAACAIEMIHTYSLVHDDLPAMDNDALRRGKPTSHVAFDEATAILAGDALLTFAFEIMSRAAGKLPGDDLHRWMDALQQVSEAAGACGMIAGQIKDILSEGHALSKTELEQLHELKTGALIRVSVRIGALLAGAAVEVIDRLDRYAKYIGLAFQVTDDVLNVEGDPKVMGKAVGTDAALQKNTYPALMGLAASKDHARKLVTDAISALDDMDAKADPLRAIAIYIIQRHR